MRFGEFLGSAQELRLSDRLDGLKGRSGRRQPSCVAGRVGPLERERHPEALFGFEATVCERAIDYLDHKFLNIDVPEFKSLNPTVENIASVVWNRLETSVPGLYSVRVYETPKTWADVKR